jgi:hypothetical protein
MASLSVAASAVRNAFVAISGAPDASSTMVGCTALSPTCSKEDAPTAGGHGFLLACAARVPRSRC